MFQIILVIFRQQIDFVSNDKDRPFSTDHIQQIRPNAGREIEQVYDQYDQRRPAVADDGYGADVVVGADIDVQRDVVVAQEAATLAQLAPQFVRISDSGKYLTGNVSGQRTVPAMQHGAASAAWHLTRRNLRIRISVIYLNSK